MAKVTDQSIPSEDRILYKRQCQIATKSRDVDYVRSRYPWRNPKMQTLTGYGVSASQKTQREKFLAGRDEFKNLTSGQKTEWKTATDDISAILHTYNFKQQNYLLEKIANEEINLGANTYPATLLTQDTSYVWIGRDFWPSKLISVNKSTLSVTVEVTFPAGYGSMKDLVQDATYVWCLFNCSPAKLARVPKADPTNYDVYGFAHGENEGKAIVDDGTYLWCGLYPSNPRLIRVTKADPTTRTTYTMAEITGNLIDLTQDDDYIWAICGNSPAAEPALIVRIQKTDASQRTSQSISGTNPAAACILSDGDYLWCGCSQDDLKAAGKLWKVTKSDLSQQTVYTVATITDPAPGESSWLADIIIDGDYLWCVPLLHNPQIFKVLRSDPANKSGWNVLFTGTQLYRLLLNGNFVWGSFFLGTTAALYKIYKYLKPYS